MYIQTSLLCICAQKLHLGLNTLISQNKGDFFLNRVAMTTVSPLKSGFWCFEAFFVPLFKLKDINIFIHSF